MYKTKDIELIIIPQFQLWMEQKTSISFWVIDGIYNRFPVGIIIVVGETLFKLKSIKGDDKGKEYTYSYACLRRFQEHGVKKGRYCIPEGDKDE